MKEEYPHLFEIITNKKWDAVAQHPFLKDDVRHIDSNGCTALYMALRHKAPLHVIKIIIYACPLAAEFENNYGSSPLQLAIDISDDETIQLLIKARPEACYKYDVTRTRPLHYALIQRNSYNIIRDLVNAAPEVILQPNRNEDTPIECFFTNWDLCLRHFLSNNQLLLTSADSSRNEILSQTLEFDGKKIELKYLYDVSCLLLQTAYPSMIEKYSNYHDCNENNNKWLALHSALASKYCPWSICQLLLHLHPDQMSKQDINGNSPLVHCMINNGSSLISHKSDIYNTYHYGCLACKSTSCIKMYKLGGTRRGQLYCDRCATRIHWIGQSECLIDVRDEETEKLNTLFYLIRENPNFVS